MEPFLRGPLFSHVWCLEAFPVFIRKLSPTSRTVISFLSHFLHVISNPVPPPSPSPPLKYFSFLLPVFNMTQLAALASVVACLLATISHAFPDSMSTVSLTPALASTFTSSVNVTQIASVISPPGGSCKYHPGGGKCPKHAPCCMNGYCSGTSLGYRMHKQTTRGVFCLTVFFFPCGS